MEGFKNTTKMKFFKTGGSVVSDKKVVNKTISASTDLAQDKALVKKGVSQHESFLHKNEPKTELKLKTGGRAKKAVGTAKKFIKPAAAPSAAVKMKTGGKVTNVYEAKKKAGDKDAIKKVKQIKATKAAAPSKAVVKAKGTPAKFCGGKSVRKYAEGKSVDVKDPQALTDKIAREENAADAAIIPNAARAVKDTVVKGYNAIRDKIVGPTNGTAGKKKGGKVKKYAGGGAVLSDDQKAWLGGADQTDPIIMARMRAAHPDVAPAQQGSYVPNANPAMDNRDIGQTGGNIDDESQWGNVSPAAAAFNKGIPGAGPVAPAAAPVRRAVPAAAPYSNSQDARLAQTHPAPAYQAPNVEQDSGVAYPQGKPIPNMYANREPSAMQRFFSATPAEQATQFRKGTEARKRVGKGAGSMFGGTSFSEKLDALGKK